MCEHGWRVHDAVALDKLHAPCYREMSVIPYKFSDFASAVATKTVPGAVCVAILIDAAVVQRCSTVLLVKLLPSSHPAP